MARQTVLTLSNYADGVYEFGPFPLQNNVNTIGAEIQRCTTATPDIWPSETTTIEVTVEYSFDNGAHWVGTTTVKGAGGIMVRNRDQQEEPTSSFVVSLPDGNGRLIRGSVNIQNGPLRSSVTLVMN